MLEHDINDAFDFGANFDPPRVDTPAPVVIAPSSSAFSTPICVVYSSDVNLPPAHAPGIVMTAGHGGGVSGGGTTTTNGSTLVTNGTSTGLSINVVWDSSVSSAPSGFTAGVLQAAQYFVDHFTDHVALNINVGFGGVGGYALNGALGMSFPTFSLVAIRRSKMRWRLIKQVRLTFQRWPRFSAIRPAAEIATAESKAMGLDELKGLEKMLEGMVKTYHSNRAFGLSGRIAAVRMFSFTLIRFRLASLPRQAPP